VDVPEGNGEIDSEDAPEMDDAGAEPGRVGTGSVPEPGQAVKNGNGIGNGNGKEWETIKNAECRSEAAQSQSHSVHEHSSFGIQQSQSGNSQSKTNARPRYLRAHHLARLFYSLLPQENQEQAAGNWEKPWTDDLNKLISGPDQRSGMEVADVMLFAFASRFKKYCVRAAGFVEMFPTISEE
jgi:hypothetical protein